MPDRNPLSRARERGRGEGETRYTSGTTPTDFRYTGQRLRSLQLRQSTKPSGVETKLQNFKSATFSYSQRIP